MVSGGIPVVNERFQQEGADYCVQSKGGFVRDGRGGWRAGTYNFTLESDDGAQLYIDNDAVADTRLDEKVATQRSIRDDCPHTLRW